MLSPKSTGGPFKTLFSTSDSWSLYLAKDLKLIVDGIEVATNGKPVVIKANGFLVPIDGTVIDASNKISGYFTRYHNIKADGTVESPEYGSGSGLRKASKNPAKS